MGSIRFSIFVTCEEIRKIRDAAEKIVESDKSSKFLNVNATIKKSVETTM